jgi:hypothetical protein
MTQYCSSCGSELAPNAKFCNRCGQGVAAMPQEEASSPQTPSSDRPGGGVRRWFAGASTPWTAMLVVSVVLAVSLVGVAAWLAVARSGEEEERTPTAPAAKPAGAVGATATPRAAASPAAPAPPPPNPELPEQPTVYSLPTPASVPTVQMPTPASIPTVQMPTPASSPTIEVPTTVPPTGLPTPEPTAPTPVPGVWLGGKDDPNPFLIEFEVSADGSTVALHSIEWTAMCPGICPSITVGPEIPISAPAPIVWGGKYFGFVVQTQYGELRGWFTSATTAEGTASFETEIQSRSYYGGAIKWTATAQY